MASGPGFEAELGRQLAAAAPRLAARRRRRDRVVGGVVGVALVVAVAIIPGLVAGDAEVDVVTSGREWAEETAGAVEVLGGVEWSEAAGSGGESSPAVVWTGGSIIALRTENGGDDVAGVRWDPATGETTPIADSGLSWRVGAAVVWTGEEVLVVGGSSGPALNRVGAAYDPDADSWRPLADPPGDVDGWDGAVAGPGVWTGTELLLWDAGLAYDPATDSWRTTTRSPLTERTGAVTVWTGSELVVWGGCHDGDTECDDTNTGLLGDGASYDRDADTWSALPASPLPPAVHAVAGWTGTEVVVTVTEDGDGGGGATALYDPGTRTWSEAGDAPLPPRRHAAAVWSGGRFVIWGGGDGRSDGGSADGAVYDAEAGRWYLLPEAPAAGRSFHTMVDTGDGIYISATRNQHPPLLLRLPDATTATAATTGAADQGGETASGCMTAAATESTGGGLVGRPIDELLPLGLRPGFEIGELVRVPVTGRLLEGEWYAVGAEVSDLGGRPLGVAVWLTPDPVVAHTGVGDRADPVLDPESWYLYAHGDLARTVSVWSPSRDAELDTDPVAAVASCFDGLPQPSPFLAGELLDGAEWVLTDDPVRGLCLAASGVDQGCDDDRTVIGEGDPPETMRTALPATPDPDADPDREEGGDLVYGYLPDGAVSVELVDAEGEPKPVEVTVHPDAGFWAAPVDPADNPAGVRYRDGSGRIVPSGES